MIGPEFASAFLKLSRAKEHFDTVKTELILWAQTDPYLVFRKSNVDGSHHSLFVELKERPPLDKLSLLTGDCIHNLRSALDNLVYAVAIKVSGSNPPPNSDTLQFPIADTREAFTKQAWRLGPIKEPELVARFKRAQPYNRPHPQLPPLLRLLADFNNADKHRLLNVVIDNVQQGEFSITLPDDRSVILMPSFSYNPGPIKSGTEFASFTMNPPNPGVNYKYKATFVISIAHSAGPSGRAFGELGYILELLINEVETIVNSFVF